MPVTNVMKDSFGLSFPEYFTALAKDYARQTGNSTCDLFHAALDDLSGSITPESVIHDNAAGPGTATSVLLEKFGPDTLPTTLVTDFNTAMISEAQEMFKLTAKITAQVMDSHNLEFPGNKFNLSITNFSIFTFKEPIACIREIHRTLQSGGTAAISTWKRFGVANIIHSAQASVRPDLPPMKVPHPEFMEKKCLVNMMVEAGFDASKLTVAERMVIVKDENLDGMTDFMLGGYTAPARNGWTNEEVQRWPEALHEAVRREKEEFGGVKMEAWIVIARK